MTTRGNVSDRFYVVVLQKTFRRVGTRKRFHVEQIRTVETFRECLHVETFFTVETFSAESVPVETFPSFFDCRPVETLHDFCQRFDV